jgi:hypothetical protein
MLIKYLSTSQTKPKHDGWWTMGMHLLLFMYFTKLRLYRLFIIFVPCKYGHIIYISHNIDSYVW